MHLQSNDDTANVVHYEFDLHFQGHAFCNRMTTLRMLYIMSLTYIFKIMHFAMYLANGYIQSQNSNGSSIRFLIGNTPFCFIFHFFLGCVENMFSQFC